MFKNNVLFFFLKCHETCRNTLKYNILMLWRAIIKFTKFNLQLRRQKCYNIVITDVLYCVMCAKLINLVQEETLLDSLLSLQLIGLNPNLRQQGFSRLNTWECSRGILKDYLLFINLHWLIGNQQSCTFKLFSIQMCTSFQRYIYILYIDIIKH